MAEVDEDCSLSNPVNDNVSDYEMRMLGTLERLCDWHRQFDGDVDELDETRMWWMSKMRERYVTIFLSCLFRCIYLTCDTDSCE